MLRSLWNGASGMTAQTAKIDMVSNNLANINTTAYKKQTGTFSDLLYQNLNPSDRPINVDPTKPVAAGSGVKVSSVYSVFTQGPITNTGRELDVAIQGKGFLEVELPDGQLAYTRDGVLQRDAEGMLVNSSGYRLSAQVFVPQEAQSLTISEGGIITAVLDDGTTEELGLLPLYNVDHPESLQPIGQNMFVATPESGMVMEFLPGESGVGVLKQGCLEGSNASLLEEMTQMISAQRAYQFNSRTVQTADEMWSMANNLKR